MRIKTPKHLHARIVHKLGFTLLELLIVVSIVSFLSTIVLASLNSVRSKSRSAALLRELLELRSAIYLYRNEEGNGELPLENIYGWYHDQSGGLNFVDALQPVADAGYIPEIPRHPNWPNNPGSLMYIVGYDSPDGSYSYRVGCGINSYSDPADMPKAVLGLRANPSSGIFLPIPDASIGYTACATPYGCFSNLGPSSPNDKFYCIPL